VNPATQRVNYEESASIDITPNTGYHIDSVTGCDGTLSGNTYTTGPITGDCSVAATFAINTYDVTAVSVPEGGGTVYPATQTVNYEESASINIMPNDDYHIASITDNGQSMPITSPYTIANVKEDHTVNVTFATGAFMVTVQFKDSNGNPIRHGIVQYYINGWQDFGMTDANGQVSKELLPLNYTFLMFWRFDAQRKDQDVAINPTVLFQTTNVTVELRKDTGSLIDTGLVEYYSAGTNRNYIGTTSGGRVTREMLPLNYTFRMSYGCASQRKDQDVAINPTVVFQTWTYYRCCPVFCWRGVVIRELSPLIPS
jgi:hypothetical protein